MNYKKMEVAEKLRHYREASVLSQKQVADALNIERSTYTKYETGDSEPGLNTIVKIAGIFNVSPMALLPTDNTAVQKTKRPMLSSRADSPIYQLSKDERGLIALYRVLDKDQKKRAHEVLADMSKND